MKGPGQLLMSNLQFKTAVKQGITGKQGNLNATTKQLSWFKYVPFQNDSFPDPPSDFTFYRTLS